MNLASFLNCSTALFVYYNTQPSETVPRVPILHGAHVPGGISRASRADREVQFVDRVYALGSLKTI